MSCSEILWADGFDKELFDLMDLISVHLKKSFDHVRMMYRIVAYNVHPLRHYDLFATDSLCLYIF